MVDRFISSLIVKLDGSIPTEYLNIIETKLRLELMDYDLTLKTKEIVPYEYQLPECYKAYMVTKKLEGCSVGTLSLYKLYIESFLNAVRLPMEKITSNIIKVYLFKTQEERGISNTSLESRRSVLCSYFTWCASEGYTPTNPMATIKPIKCERKQRKPLNNMELELVRESCSDIREKAIIEFFYATGCRVTEMERMNRDDVNFDTNEVHLFGKGNKHRTSYLTAKAHLYLKEYLSTRDDNEEALFVYSRNPHERLRKEGIEKIVKEIGQKAGIDRLHPHLIRHTTATNYLRQGMNITQIQKLLGHSSIDTTMIYAEVNSDDMKHDYQKYAR